MKTTPHKTLILRVSPALVRALKAAAKADHRSVNSLVEHVLAERFLPAQKGKAL
jgi:hypothetical protein